MEVVKRLRDRLTASATEVDAEQIRLLRRGNPNMRPISVQPPAHGTVPTTIRRVLQTVYQRRTGLLGIGNRSRPVVFEIRRATPDTVTLQFCVETEREERTLRTQLAAAIDGIEFGEGVTGLPIAEGQLLGGGLLVPKQAAWNPLRAEFESPPTDAVLAALHRHAMQDTSFVIQLLCVPVAGQPLRTRLFRYRARKQSTYLREHSEQLVGRRTSTVQERSRAAAIERKVRQPLWWVSIRVVVVGTGEYTVPRLQEVCAGFNVFENPESGQGLQVIPVSPVRSTDIVRFGRSVAKQRFRQWSRRFRVSSRELGALVAVPTGSREL